MTRPAVQATATNNAPSALQTRGKTQAAASRALVEEYLAIKLPRQFGHPVTILGAQWEDIKSQTSFAAQILTLQLDGAGPLQLFVKDFSSSILPKDNLAERSSRELGVYRDLLPKASLGTPRFYGAVQFAEQTGFCLLIEFVEGVWLKYRTFDDWVRAAGWLGNLHGTFMHKPKQLATADFLQHHDVAFFNARAEMALQAVAQFSSGQAEQLAQVLAGYDNVIDVMVSQPPTLVHGSFRVNNILVATNGPDVRVCPVDWELAATGGGLHDLAFIAHGYAPDKIDILLDAYRKQLSRHCTPWSDRADMLYAMNCYLLHKVVKSLGDAVILDFSNTVVNKYLDMAKSFRQALDARQQRN
jgi:hypothetical protein